MAVSVVLMKFATTRFEYASYRILITTKISLIGAREYEKKLSSS
jgi:hypothetical protein